MSARLPHKLTLLLLAAALACPAQAHLEFFLTGFEFDNAGTFSAGESPLTANFSGGTARAVSKASYAKTGVNAWHIPSGGTTLVTFDTAADQVDFWIRDADGAAASTYRIYDTSNILLAEGTGTKAFANVIVTRGGGQSRISRVEFASAGGDDTLVDDFSFAANENPVITNITVKLEEPVENQVHGGIGNLRGWAISPDGISHIEIYIDGAFAFEAPYGGNRPDVAAQFPETTNSISSGFSLAFGYSNLLPGEHTVTARAFTPLGAQKDASATFSVVAFDKAFIGPNDAVSTTSATLTPSGDEISIENISIDGRVYDLKLKWRTAEQGFEIIEIR